MDCAVGKGREHGTEKRVKVRGRGATIYLGERNRKEIRMNSKETWKLVNRGPVADWCVCFGS